MKIIFGILINTLLCISAVNASLVDTIKNIKPSVVGVGLYTPLGQPRAKLHGSGFVIGNGKYVVTNHHVIPKDISPELKQQVAIFIKSGNKVIHKKARIVAVDEAHDLAILAVNASNLKPFKLADELLIEEGSEIAFTGFPIGGVLGLYPVTHRGIIAAITPTITPVESSKLLNLKRLKQLRNPFMVYQLDATAYPGNSGSALYDINSGAVVGIINKVFVQNSKESVLEKPSGITYAIPVKYLHDMIRKNKLKL